MIIGIRGGLYSGKDTVYEIINMVDNNYSREEIVDSLERWGGSPLGIKEEWENKKFAYKLKQMVALLLGVSVERLEDRDSKEAPLGEEWVRYYGIDSKGDFITKLFTDFEEAEMSCLSTPGLSKIIREELTPRRILQLLGTQGGRELIHPQIWVNALFADLKGDSRWVITDVRFPNEAEAILDRGGSVINLVRKLHPTEWCKLFNINDDFSHLAKTFKCTSVEFGHRLDETHVDLRKKLLHKSETALDNYNKFTVTIENDGTLDELVVKIFSVYMSLFNIANYNRNE